MGLSATLILYLMCGAGVAAAVLLRENATPGERLFKLIAAWLFWPLFVPSLLSAPAPPVRSAALRNHTPADDKLSRAVARVEAELERALLSLDGWAEQTLANERDRLDELKLAWRAQAARIGELSDLLAELRADDVAAGAASVAADDRISHSEQSRLDNIERLTNLRCQMEHDLLGTLAWVRELATMIHLAKYSGAPASRADELVSQIAAAVEGLSAVAAWEFPATASTETSETAV